MDKVGVVIRLPPDNKCPGCGQQLEATTDPADGLMRCPVHGTKYLEVEADAPTPELVKGDAHGEG